jgi:hypothetical protein
MHKKLLSVFSMLALSSAFAAPHCPDGEPYEGRGEAASIKDAQEDADLAISRSISNSVSSVSRKFVQQVETADNYEERSERTRLAKVETNARLLGVKDKNGYPKCENGKCVAERYICTKDAAAPYLNSLKDLARTLKIQTQAADGNSCKGINETYQKIDSLETVLKIFARTSSEVRVEYETLRKEYQSDGKSGIFLEIKEDIFGEKSDAIGSKLKEVLSENNCRIERNVCKANGDFTLRINAAACNHKNDGTFDHCTACLKVDLLNGRNEIVTSPKVEAKAAWVNKSAACEKAFEMSAPEIYSKIKDKITEVCK